jgi:hypothetical protein
MLGWPAMPSFGRAKPPLPTLGRERARGIGSINGTGRPGSPRASQQLIEQEKERVRERERTVRASETGNVLRAERDERRRSVELGRAGRRKERLALVRAVVLGADGRGVVARRRRRRRWDERHGAGHRVRRVGREEGGREGGRGWWVECAADGAKELRKAHRPPRPCRSPRRAGRTRPLGDQLPTACVLFLAEPVVHSVQPQAWDKRHQRLSV